MARNIRVRAVVSIVVAVLLLVSPVAPAWAQNRTDVKPSGPRQQLAVIIFSGLGGAVLGLSTLSFYGRPQDHLNNIAIGFALGVIGGTIFTTYRTATKPYYDNYRTGNYDLRASKPDDILIAQRAPTAPWTPTLSYSWDF